MKRFIALFSVLVLLAAGVTAMRYDYENVAITYDGSDTKVENLYNDPYKYNTSDPDGVADIIVKTNLEKTMAANNVAAIVFDYRGFDTIGESFILLAAIAGSFAILRTANRKEDDHKDEA
ncbi:MAG: hypothetical protein II974_07510 [Firmicutes bacterium]|nr:hypothetical protein [Bacillota bacterium]